MTFPNTSRPIRVQSSASPRAGGPVLFFEGTAGGWRGLVRLLSSFSGVPEVDPVLRRWRFHESRISDSM